MPREPSKILMLWVLLLIGGCPQDTVKQKPSLLAKATLGQVVYEHLWHAQTDVSCNVQKRAHLLEHQQQIETAINHMFGESPKAPSLLVVPNPAWEAILGLELDVRLIAAGEWMHAVSDSSTQDGKDFLRILKTMLVLSQGSEAVAARDAIEHFFANKDLQSNLLDALLLAQDVVDEKATPGQAAFIVAQKASTYQACSEQKAQFLTQHQAAYEAAFDDALLWMLGLPWSSAGLSLEGSKDLLALDVSQSLEHAGQALLALSDSSTQEGRDFIRIVTRLMKLASSPQSDYPKQLIKRFFEDEKLRNYVWRAHEISNELMHPPAWAKDLSLSYCLGEKWTPYSFARATCVALLQRLGLDSEVSWELMDHGEAYYTSGLLSELEADALRLIDILRKLGFMPQVEKPSFGKEDLEAAVVALAPWVKVLMDPDAMAPVWQLFNLHLEWATSFEALSCQGVSWESMDEQHVREGLRLIGVFLTDKQGSVAKLTPLRDRAIAYYESGRPEQILNDMSRFYDILSRTAFVWGPKIMPLDKAAPIAFRLPPKAMMQQTLDGMAPFVPRVLRPQDNEPLVQLSSIMFDLWNMSPHSKCQSTLFESLDEGHLEDSFQRMSEFLKTEHGGMRSVLRLVNAVALDNLSKR